jgi:hypothetical protein
VERQKDASLSTSRHPNCTIDLPFLNIASRHRKWPNQLVPHWQFFLIQPTPAKDAGYTRPVMIPKEAKRQAKTKMRLKTSPDCELVSGL